MADADAAVEFLLGNIEQLLLNHANLISSATKTQVEKLRNDLDRFKVFLRSNSDNKWRKNGSVRHLIQQIRDVVYEAEDVIDAIVVQAVESKSTNYFLRASLTPEKLHTVAEQAETVADEIHDFNGERNRSGLFLESDQIPPKSKAPSIRQDNVVGFEHEADTIRRYLFEETEELDVISIIGMPGLGKTTLAWNIFDDCSIGYNFPIRLWLCISQEFTTKDVFLAILRMLTSISEDMYSKSDQELAQLVATTLEGLKFLIVMDDVWTTEDWDKLQIALPKSNKKGKVLITSRHNEVALCANRNRRPHNLRLLDARESRLLLQLEIFGQPDCPPALKAHVKRIAEQCDGLPLAIVVIGDIVVKKLSASNEMTAKENAMKKVSESVNTYLFEDPERRMEKSIGLSYDKLPNYLRACFLYLGIFPEDFEIPAWNLICLWVAEGFVQQNSGMSLEKIAQGYLDDLVNMNLVTIDKIKSDGMTKTCRIHRIVRDFSRTRAGYERENLFQEIKRTSEGDFYPPICDMQKYRRLFTHSHVLDFVCSEPYGPSIRSFVCFSKEEITLPAENVSAIPAAFKLLRVLDVKPTRFPRLPIILYQLVHLRYIVLSFTLSILPAAFSKLWNLQTLVVDTKSPTLEIKADILEMIQLRHLKTNASATLPDTRKNSKGGEQLQTLGIIAPESCTEEVFERARDLKTLGIHGQLALLLDTKSGRFDSFGKLGNLEKLKLLNDVFYGVPEGQLFGLPQPYKFPPKLRSLTLSDTFLDWSHMSILGLLENLEILKLKHKAFMGKTWEVADGGFCRLEVLHIGPTDLNIWVADGHHFPCLRRLELHHCEQLQEVPIGLADIPSLELLDLYRSKFAASSAWEINEKKRKQEEQATVFKLSIFPGLV